MSAPTGPAGAGARPDKSTDALHDGARTVAGGVLGFDSWAERAASGLLDFKDDSLEWRRLISEFVGTFLLVVAGAGGGVVDAYTHGQIGRAAAVTAPALTVMAIILFMGAVSGAHLNPAVSIAFALRLEFPWRRVPGYIIVQLLGATAAC